jgi:hypothetical protein
MPCAFSALFVHVVFSTKDQIRRLQQAPLAPFPVDPPPSRNLLQLNKIVSPLGSFRQFPLRLASSPVFNFGEAR